MRCGAISIPALFFWSFFGEAKRERGKPSLQEKEGAESSL
jgi:hypothetical protein